MHFNLQYFDLLVTFTKSELVTRYKRAWIGFLWILINPFLQMLIMGFVLSNYIAIPNYYIFLFSGLLPWQFFSSSVSKATKSFSYQSVLISKNKFPLVIIPLSVVLSQFIELLAASTLFVFFLLLTGQINVMGIGIYYFSLFLLLLFTASTSLLTASLDIRFRDTSFLVQALITIWFYSTPILYDTSGLPPSIQQLLSLNPLALPIELIHYAIFGKGLITFDLVSINMILILIILTAAVIIYNNSYKKFVDLF